MADSKNVDITEWVKQLYNVNDITSEELRDWQERYSYKGYSRDKVLIEFMKLVPDKKLAIQIIIVCALKGPQRAANTKLTDGRTITQVGIPASGVKGTDAISCQRIMAATADLAAYYLKVLNVPKRIEMDCPAWLQFPSAGAIMLPMEERKQHIEFSHRFSTLIGGVFNEQIYTTMMKNAYYNENLALFKPFTSSLDISSSNSSSSSASSSVPQQSTQTPTSQGKPSARKI